MKRVLYFVAFLCLGISLGWLGRSQCHPHSALGSWSLFHSLCMVSGRPPGPPGGPGGPGAPPPEQFLDELNVSDAQRSKIKAIDAARRPELERLRSEMMKKREALDEALAGSAPASEVAPKFEAVFDAKRAAETEQFKMMMEVRAELTPEQRQELEKQKKGRHGPFHGGPGGP